MGGDNIEVPLTTGVMETATYTSDIFSYDSRHKLSLILKDFDSSYPCITMHKYYIVYIIVEPVKLHRYWVHYPLTHIMDWMCYPQIYMLKP